MRPVKLDITYSPEGTECVLTHGHRAVTVIFPKGSGEVDFSVQEYASPESAEAARTPAGETE